MSRPLRIPLLVLSGLAVALAVAAIGFGASSAASGSPVVGVACTPWVARDVPINQRLGNKLCRVEFSITASFSDMDTVIGAYAAAGVQVQPLAGFDLRSRGLPTTSEAQGLKAWALRYGPGGSFWQGKANPVPIVNIEFGNETSYSYQGNYGGASDPAYATMAKTYALRAKDAAQALAGSGVGLLIQLDDADGWPWVSNLKAAVPDLDHYAAGWTVHPYGTSGTSKVQRVLSQAASAGWSSSVPLYFTEWGLATDNGRTLSDNYGFSPSMTYAGAATTLQSTMADWNSAFGSRLSEVIYYMITDLAGSGASTDREDYFGAVTNSGADKGALTAALRTLVGGSPTAAPAPTPAPAPAPAPAPTPAPAPAPAPKTATTTPVPVPAPAPAAKTTTTTTSTTNTTTTTTPAPVTVAPTTNPVSRSSNRRFRGRNAGGNAPSTLSLATTYVTEWDGRLFPNAGALRGYLTGRGVVWSEFLARHPAVAKQAGLPSVTWNGRQFFDQASLTHELTRQGLAYRVWAKSHATAAAILAGRAVASVKQQPVTRSLADAAVISWAGVGFTSARGLRTYVTQQGRSWDAFLAEHPAIVGRLHLTSVTMDRTPFFSRGALATWLGAHGSALATWSANHPGVAERLMP